MARSGFSRHILRLKTSKIPNKTFIQFYHLPKVITTYWIQDNLHIIHLFKNEIKYYSNLWLQVEVIKFLDRLNAQRPKPEPVFIPVGELPKHPFSIIGRITNSLTAKLVIAASMFLFLFFSFDTELFAKNLTAPPARKSYENILLSDDKNNNAQNGGSGKNNTEIFLDEKTVTGYVVDEDNQPWNNQLAHIYFGDSLIASDTIRNGYFTFENAFTKVEDNIHIPTEITLEQNYPNPFNPSTVIRYSLAKPQIINITVYDILGREVKTLVDNIFIDAGTHEVIWNGDNNKRTGVSAGVYFYRLTSEDGFRGTKKMILLDGNSYRQSPHYSFTNKERKLKKTQTDVYRLVVKGEDLLTTSVNINTWLPSPINMGTITAPKKPILRSAANGVYDLKTKWDSLNNRLTPTGIQGLKVSLGSDENTYTFTDSQGQFSLKVDKTGTDSLLITGANITDTLFYNYQKPITITLGENKITAFNDTTGIPMITRMYDDTVGVDFLDYFCYVTAINDILLGDPVWKQTLSRVRDEDLPIKTFMNRAIAPNYWYVDSTLAGLKATETGRYQFKEVSTADSALLIMKYDHWAVGQGVNVGIQYNPSDGHYIYHWEIRIRGPPAAGTLDPLVTATVVAHEDLHIAFAIGKHSLYIQDIFYMDASWRASIGYPLKMSAREEKAVWTIYALERNPKLLHYKK